MVPLLQAKLLRFLEEKSFKRVGGAADIKVDVRVIAATNRNLREMVDRGEFREDLFFRLNVVRVAMPPLRTRREDIVLLANGFLREFAAENGRTNKPLTDKAMRILIDYQWPGNVRELRTAIEHGVVMSNEDSIDVRHLPEFLRSPGPSAMASASRDGSGEIPLDARGEFNLHELEIRTIRAALLEAGDNRTHAAELLGLSRRTLQRKLKELGI
jgi:DNA-binding NtrC family response regulator